MHSRGSLRRAVGDVVENGREVGKGRKHGLIGRAWPEQLDLFAVANSPRAAARLERPIASRSSGERATGAGKSEPASCMMTRAISS